MLLTQFPPVAAGLRATAGLSGAEQAFTCDPDSAGVTGQGLTCDSRGRRDLGELEWRVSSKYEKQNKTWLLAKILFTEELLFWLFKTAFSSLLGEDVPEKLLSPAFVFRFTFYFYKVPSNPGS